jgi:hypothetical protein
MKGDYQEKGLPCPVETIQDWAFVIPATQAKTMMYRLWPNQRALWIADESRAKLPMNASLRRYQRRAIMPDEPTTKFDYILDTVYFGQSHEAIGLQLADACNSFIKRHHMGDSSAERFFQMVYPFIPERDAYALYSDKDDRSL